MYRGFGKRVFDLVLVIPAIVFFSPIMLVLAGLTRLSNGSPVFFRQRRPGRGGKPFWVTKFRTMTEERDPQGVLRSDTDRLTHVGRFLRSTSLDELPELGAVLRGHMSLVGPRPLLTKYQAYYSPEERRRFDVRPGITGWAQVHGRNHTPWDERLAYDVWYVDHLSLILDIKILLVTLHQVVHRKDVAVDAPRVMIDLDEERRVRESGGNLWSSIPD